MKSGQILFGVLLLVIGDMVWAAAEDKSKEFTMSEISYCMSEEGVKIVVAMSGNSAYVGKAENLEDSARTSKNKAPTGSPQRAKKPEVVMMGLLADPCAADLLIQKLKDENTLMRKSAAKVLGELGDRRAVQSLISALKDESPYVRKTAAEALGNLDDKLAGESLISALEDKDYSVRASVAEALGKIRYRPASEHLISILKGDKGYVRRRAAKALGLLKEKRAIEPLILMLEIRGSFDLGAWEAAEALVVCQD